MASTLSKHKSDSNFLPQSTSSSFNTPQNVSRLSYLQSANDFYNQNTNCRLSKCGTVLSEARNTSQMITGVQNNDQNKVSAVKRKIDRDEYYINYNNGSESKSRGNIIESVVNRERKKTIEVRNKKYQFHSPQNHKFQFDGSYYYARQTLNRKQVQSQCDVYSKLKIPFKDMCKLIKTPQTIGPEKAEYKFQCMSPHQANQLPVSITNYNYYFASSSQYQIQDQQESNFFRVNPTNHLRHPMHHISQLGQRIQREQEYKYKTNQTITKLNQQQQQKYCHDNYGQRHQKQCQRQQQHIENCRPQDEGIQHLYHSNRNNFTKQSFSNSQKPNLHNRNPSINDFISSRVVSSKYLKHNPHPISYTNLANQSTLQEYEQYNILLERKNEKLESMISEKVLRQKELIKKLKTLMGCIQQYKQQQIDVFESEEKQKMEKKQFTLQSKNKYKFRNQIENKRVLVDQKIKSSSSLNQHINLHQNASQTLLLNSSCSNQNQDSFKHIKTSKEQYIGNKRDVGDKSDVSRAENMQLISCEETNSIYQKSTPSRNERPSRHKKLTIFTDSILEYSLIDESTLNPSRNDSSHNQKTANQYSSDINISNQCLDLSISGFDSRLVPRLTNKEKLQQLEDMFEVQIRQCYIKGQEKYNRYHPLQHITSDFKGTMSGRNINSANINSANINSAKHVHQIRQPLKHKLKQMCKEMKTLRQLISHQQKQPDPEIRSHESLNIQRF